MKSIKNKIIILVLIFVALFLVNNYFLKYDLGGLLSTTRNIFKSSSVEQPSQSSQPQIKLTVRSPRQYQVVKISELVKLELAQPYIDGGLEVLLLSLDNTQPDKPVKQSYNLGNQKFNRGFIELNTKDYPAGQYKFALSKNGQSVAESFVFTLAEETQKLDFINPTPNKLLQNNNKVINWTSTPDIYFVNVYLENDFERFVLAQNLINTGTFDWNFTDRFDRVIADGEYVLLVEDNFNKSILNKVRFQLKK